MADRRRKNSTEDRDDDGRGVQRSRAALGEGRYRAAAGGSLLQAIARRYYLAYTYALQAAEKHGVSARQGVAAVDRRLTHQVLPNVVRALYTSRNSGPVLGGGRASRGSAG
jgi:hypothetical protein